MKKNKLKRVRLVMQTMEAGVKEENCVPVFTGMTIERPEPIKMNVAPKAVQKWTNFDGTVDIEIRAGRIDIEKGGEKPAGPAGLDYNYFCSRYSKIVVSEVEAEIFDCGGKKNTPCRIKNIELIFGNRKRIELLERTSVFELERLAS